MSSAQEGRGRGVSKLLKHVQEPRHEGERERNVVVISPSSVTADHTHERHKADISFLIYAISFP